MRSLRFVVVGAMCAAVLVACGPPPSTPGPVEPTEPPVVPRMLMAPFGGTGLAAITRVSTTWPDDYYISTATAHRKLDVEGDLDDRRLVLEALGELDPATGHVVRKAGGPELWWLEMCESAADDAACTALPDTDYFDHRQYSPDGSKLMLGMNAREDDPVNRLRVVDATTFETIVEVAGEFVGVGLGQAAWSPDSSQLALTLNQGLAVLAVAPGAEPVALMGADHAYPPEVRQIAGVVGWTAQGRIVTGWRQWAGSIFDTRPVLEFVDPDGSSLREFLDVEGAGWPAIAPDGSVVMPIPSGAPGGGSAVASSTVGGPGVKRPSWSEGCSGCCTVSQR